ncbi:MAG: UDP-N-acetylglucosamine 4-epimerase [Chlamydiae bacterium]|nr:UDP-N-acetylglucosamine 4-epimerase [Chlamydiota bacterium]
MIEEKRIFLTGAAGFIGFHAIQAFHKRGDRVIGYDNFNGYYDPALKEARVQELKKIGIEVIRGDLCDQEKLDSEMTEFGTTHVVHLAAQPGVRSSLENPQACVKSNEEGFVNVIESCRKLNAKLIYASSSSVYGLNKKVPFSEEDRTDQPASLYGATKKSNEVTAHSYSHVYGMHVTGLRFFTVYGPWGRPDMAYYLFTKAIMNGDPIKVFNHGKMKRDFTYIDDVVDGIVAAVDLGAECEIFNLGNHKSIELGTFIETIENTLGKKAEKKMLPMQLGDVVETYADIEHSRAELGFEPKVSIEEGIQKFIDWYKSYYK